MTLNNKIKFVNLILFFILFSCKETITDKSVKNEIKLTQLQKDDDQKPGQHKGFNNEEKDSIDFFQGTYVLKSQDNCDLKISLEKDYYKITTIEKKSEGEFILVLNGNDSILRFKNYLVNDTIALQAYYEKQTLTIQNYGNAMNDYIFFNECNSKYIKLVRK